jgi:hypothetical protein
MGADSSIAFLFGHKYSIGLPPPPQTLSRFLFSNHGDIHRQLTILQVPQSCLPPAFQPARRLKGGPTIRETISYMQITWLGHGTFKFQLPSGQVIVMDPWTDGNPAYPKGFEIDRVDIICISHGHFDHIHDAVPLATRFSPEVIGIFETCVWLESKGVKNTRAMNKGGSQKVGGVTITMTHAVHSCGNLDGGNIN